MRGIFFDEDDARAVVARLVADGYDARTERERLAGEDDDEDHPWAVLTDAPELVLELLVDRYDGTAASCAAYIATRCAWMWSGWP